MVASDTPLNAMSSSTLLLTMNAGDGVELWELDGKAATESDAVGDAVAVAGKLRVRTGVCVPVCV